MNMITLAAIACSMGLLSFATANEIPSDESPSQVQIVADGKPLTFAIVVTKRLKEGVLATVLHTTIRTKREQQPEGLPPAYAGRTLFITGLSSMAEVNVVWTATFVHVGTVTTLDGTPLIKPVEKWKVEESRWASLRALRERNPHDSLPFDMIASLRQFLTALLLVAFIGCAHAGDDRGEQAAIATARRAVAEHESWPHGAEFTAQPTKDGWAVTAWRIEYPNNKGATRFVPGGFRSITIDRAGRVTQYLRGH